MNNMIEKRSIVASIFAYLVIAILMGFVIDFLIRDTPLTVLALVIFFMLIFLGKDIYKTPNEDPDRVSLQEEENRDD